MAKRSPILGYNHNVRYRGIVFHVQTEDSGIINPHVFSHLFHGGVILSTRKLVYDPDATEEVVKALMQAQHKAVLKELRRGAFDDKIDLYLAGSVGLLPRGVAQADTFEPTPVEDVPAPPPAELAEPAMTRADSGPSIEFVDEPSQPIELDLPPPLTPSLELHDEPPLDPLAGWPPPPPSGLDADLLALADETERVPVMAMPEISQPMVTEAGLRDPRPTPSPAVRVSFVSSRRPSAPLEVVSLDESLLPEPGRSPLAGSSDLFGSELTPAALPYGERFPPQRPATVPPPPRTTTAPRDPGLDPTMRAHRLSPTPVELTNPTGEPPARSVGRPPSHDTVPRLAGVPAPTPPVTAPQAARVETNPSTRPLGSRVPQPSYARPSSETVPRVPILHATIHDDDLHNAGLAETEDVAEVHAAPLPSAAQPPGVQPERPGEYYVTRSKPEAPTARPTVPPRTGSSTTRSDPGARAAARPTGGTFRNPVPAPPSPVATRARPLSRPPPSGVPSARVDPPRSEPVTSPRQPPSRGAPRARPATGAGVVVSRPAVIVGAPSRPISNPGTGRTRRARETGADGQVSERSLDEVILAYLSEDGGEE